jgi:hypothetical protein
MNQSLIWGTILVVLGLSLILKSLFHITVPLVRPLIGALLVYLGLSIMMDPFTESVDKKTIIFGKSTLYAHEAVHTYNITFASGVIDLSALEVNQPRHVTVNIVFGSGELLLNAAVPTKVTVNALCSRAALPDETLVSFGRNAYTTINDQDPRLIIHVNAVFANIDVKELVGASLPQSTHETAVDVAVQS